MDTKTTKMMLMLLMKLFSVAAVTVCVTACGATEQADEGTAASDFTAVRQATSTVRCLGSIGGTRVTFTYFNGDVAINRYSRPRFAYSGPANGGPIDGLLLRQESHSIYGDMPYYEIAAYADSGPKATDVLLQANIEDRDANGGYVPVGSKSRLVVNEQRGGVQVGVTDQLSCEAVAITCNIVDDADERHFATDDGKHVRIVCPE